MKRGKLVLVTTLALTIAVLACRDLTSPHDGRQPGSSSHLVNPSGTVVVSPSDMHGWAFYNDQNSTLCTDSAVCRLVDGPAGQPLGTGSAELATAVTGDGKALILKDYLGTRFDAITELRYSTFRQSVDSGNNLAIAFQVNADYDLSDAATGWQGRLVFEPYQGIGGNVPQGAWQSWDAKAGKWWGTKASVSKAGVVAANPCVQASPCTWAQLLAAFPNVGVHATYGAVILKAGSGWPAFRGNADDLSIGVNGLTATYDFELQATPAVPLVPPDTAPFALFDSLGTISGGSLPPGLYRKDIVLVEFKLRTSLADRQAAIDSVGGRVVGGKLHPDRQDGAYYIRISGGTTEALSNAVRTLQRQPQVGLAAWWAVSVHDDAAYRRPIDGDGWKTWLIDPASPNAGRINWASEYVRAPMAWGCSVGSTATTVGVLDVGMHLTDNLRGNVDIGTSAIINDSSEYDHGTRVASILASVGNDDSGMTGMAWRARLILRDRLSSTDTLGVRFKWQQQHQLIEDHLFAVGMDGASIINISLAVKTNDQADITSARQAVTQAIARLADTGRFPLFVISAGNENRDARLAGFAAAKEVYPNQVLVVGGLNVDGSVWAQSNFGSLTDIYAPGVRVAQANRLDKIVTDQGTSFAAPLVAGVAVLLKDFDPSLSSADLIAMITSGARVEGGIRKLDAYGALRKAAARVGAPLCGNRVWNDGNNQIIAERDSVTTESIITDRDPFDYAAFVNPFHGGKRIEVGFSYRYDWNSTSRKFEPGNYVRPAGFPIGAGGAWASYAYVADHDNTMRASRTDTLDATGQVSRLKLVRSSNGLLMADLQSQHLPGTDLPPPLACIMEYPVDIDGNAEPFVPTFQFSGGYRCMGYGPVGAWNSAPSTIPRTGEINRTPILGSVAPQGDAVFVPVNIRRIDVQRGDIVGHCNSDDADPQYSDYTVRRCSAKSVDLDSAVRAMVYRVDTLTKQWTLIPLRDSGSTSLESREINSLAVSEDGKEIMLSTTQRANDLMLAGDGACRDETLEWISIDRSAAPKHPPGKVIKRVTLRQGASCGGWVEAGGTISPSRTPSGQPPLRMTPQPRRP